MKCPKCGTTNGKTNKYCRECGLQLEGLAEEQARPRDQAAAASDEVALGEELFEVWELLKSGDLDSALEKGEQMLGSSPESASAHSLVALIYERKAEHELAEGNVSGGHQFLKFAVAQYERIIDLNPDSTADREKVASLRRRLTGGPAGMKAKPAVGLRAAFRAVPPPLVAGFGAFLAILALAIILMPRAEEKPAGAEPAGTGAASQAVGATVTQNAPKAPPSAGLRVHTFPAAPRALMPAAPIPQPHARSEGTPSNVGPIKLPSLGRADLKIVPGAAETERKPATTTTPPDRPAPTTETPPRANPGANMLAQAIQLHNQGLPQQAIGAAEQAIALYQADIEAGKNVDAAKRGVANAKKLVTVWRQSLVEEQ